MKLRFFFSTFHLKSDGMCLKYMISILCENYHGMSPLLADSGWLEREAA